MRQGPHPVGNEFLDQVAPRYSGGPHIEEPLRLRLLLPLRIVETPHNNVSTKWQGQTRQAFDIPGSHIKPKVPPIAPLIPSIGDYLDNFSRGLPSPWRDGA
jgi:hypothetical protein